MSEVPIPPTPATSGWWTGGRSTPCSRCESTAATSAACSLGSATTRPACTTSRAARTPADQVPVAQDAAFATDGIVSFSAAPLRLALNVGFVVSVLSFLLGLAAIVLKLIGVDYVVPGWASIVVAMTFLSGVQLTVLGVMGEYIARIYEEVKQRPLYLVRDGALRRPIPRDDGARPSRGGQRMGEFDAYSETYRESVQRSIDFAARSTLTSPRKADLLLDITARDLGRATMPSSSTSAAASVSPTRRLPIGRYVARSRRGRRSGRSLRLIRTLR